MAAREILSAPALPDGVFCTNDYMAMGLTSWGNSVLDLESNKIDIHFGLAPAPQRRQAIDFTNPLFHNLNTVVAKKVTGLQDLGRH